MKIPLKLSLPLFILLSLCIFSVGVKADVVLNMTFNLADGVYNNTYAEDISGYEHNGKMNGASSIYPFSGKVDEAYDFTTTNPTMNISDFTEVGNGLKNISVFMWIKMSSATGTLMAHYDTGFNKRSWRLEKNGVSNSVARILLSSDGTALCTMSSTSIIGDNSFHHVGFTFNNGNVSLYVDGSMVNTSTCGFATLYNSDQPITINSHMTNGVPEGWSDGVIDEVLLYNVSLKSGEVNTLYHSYDVPVINDWYINSINGNDSNDGSSANPVKTLTKANSLDIHSGDNVTFTGDFFSPSDAFFTNFINGNSENFTIYKCIDCTFYGALNVSNTANWTNGGSGNVWTSTFTTPYDTQVFFNNSAGDKSSTLVGANTQGEFYYDTGADTTAIYSISNPATFYNKVHVATRKILFDLSGKSYIKITGFNIRDVGIHAIDTGETANSHFINITNNNIVGVGGTYQSSTLQYGNCIQVSLTSDNVHVINNTVGECWDAGITNQAWLSEGTKYQYNNTFEYNKIFNSAYGYEYFSSDASSITHNTLIDHNTIVNSGSGWFAGQSGHNDGRCMRLARTPADTVNFNVTNNICYNSQLYEYDMGSASTTAWAGAFMANYNLFFKGGTNFASFNGTIYSTFATYRAGKGANYDINSLSANPLFLSTDPTSEDFLVPASDSPTCSMSSTGDYVGALPCAEAPEYNPLNISFINFTSPPTPLNGTSQSENYIVVNVTANNTDLNISTFIDFDDSLVSWWTMDAVSGSGETVYDYFGRHNASAIGGATESSDGFLRHSIQLDGAGDYLNITTLDAFPYQNLTYCAYFKANSYPATDMRIITGGSEASYPFMLSITDTNALISAGSYANHLTASTGTILTAGVWYFGCGTRNPEQVFLNGVLISETTSDSWSTTPYTKIGSRGDERDFNGSIDDVMIFNRTLSPSEISNLYANTSQKYLQKNFTNLEQGTHSFKAYMQDTNGQITFTEERIFDFDFPSVPSFITIPDNQTLEYEENLSVDFDSDIEAVFTVNDTTNFQINDSTGILTNKIILAVGFYPLNITINNSGSASSVYWWVNITKNTESCSVYFNETSPLEYLLVFRVSTNCTSEYELFRNGTAIVNNSEQYLAVGTYNFTVIRNDTVNYSNIRQQELFIVQDTTPPTVTLNVSNQLIEAVTGTTTINTTAWDANEIAEHSINITYPNGSLEFEMIGIPSNFSQTFSETVLGRFNVTAWATDIYGNTAYNYYYYIIQDTTFPSINFTYPTEINNSNISRNYIMINLTWNDLLDDTAVIYLYNSSFDLINSSNSSISPFEYNFTNLADGTYYFNATANDTSKNINFTETRKVTIDTVLSIMITINSPTATTYSDYVRVEITALNASSVWYIIEGSHPIGKTIYSSPVNINLADGNYIMTAFANNSVGNMANISVSFSVDLPSEISNQGSSSNSGITYTSPPEEIIMPPVNNTPFQAVIDNIINQTVTQGNNIANIAKSVKNKESLIQTWESLSEADRMILTIFGSLGVIFIIFIIFISAHAITKPKVKNVKKANNNPTFYRP